MAEPSNYIRPGAKLTGAALLKAILSARNAPVFGGSRLIGSSIGNKQTMRVTGHQIIGGTKEMRVILTSNAGIQIATNRYKYPWVTGIGTGAAGTFWITNAAEPMSTTPGWTHALNFAEQLNTANTVTHGVGIPQPGVTITMLPIPTGTPCVVFRETLDVSGNKIPWFYALNALTVDCLP